MTRDYRTVLRAKGVKPIARLKLRTEKAAGTVEIVRDHRRRGEWKLHYYRKGTGK